MEYHVIYKQEEIEDIEREMEGVAAEITAFNEGKSLEAIDACTVCGVIRSTILPLLLFIKKWFGKIIGEKVLGDAINILQSLCDSLCPE